MTFRTGKMAANLIKMTVAVVILGGLCTRAYAADLLVLEGGTQSEETAGIFPIPDYGADIWSRSYLSGDWGGTRTELAERGIQFDVDFLQWVDTVVDGGKTNKAKYGGNATYNLKVDLMRAGLIPGAFLQVRAESRYGQSGLLNTGQIIPNNTAALSPTNYSDIDGGYDIALTNLTYVQFLSEQFGVILGKLDMYADGDTNEFAGGRGRTQFMNWSLNVGTPFLFVPASTIGAGIIYNPNQNLSITSLLISGTECTVSSCFNNLDDKGGVSLTTATYQYSLDGLPGGVTAYGAYFFGGDFTDISSIAPVPDEGLVGSTKSDSWIAGASFFQYLSVEEPHEGPLNLTNREPDLEGWGIFARLFFADEVTNPWRTSVAVGVGGRGVVPNRPDDVFGLGYFYNDLTETIFQTVGFKDHSQGFEGFYNLAITPAAKFSANVQYLPSSVPGVDDSTMVNGRLQLIF